MFNRFKIDWFFFTHVIMHPVWCRWLLALHVGPQASSPCNGTNWIFCSEQCYLIKTLLIVMSLFLSALFFILLPSLIRLFVWSLRSGMRPVILGRSLFMLSFSVVRDNHLNILKESKMNAFWNRPHLGVGVPIVECALSCKMTLLYVEFSCSKMYLLWIDKWLCNWFITFIQWQVIIIIHSWNWLYNLHWVNFLHYVMSVKSQEYHA